jgi:hypothetical protein
LVICTETYYRRFRGHEKPTIGRGADWEGNLITLEIYNKKSRTTKFASVLFASQDEQFIPEPLCGHSRYLLNSEENYAKLYAYVIGQVGVPAGALGPLKTLAPNPVGPLRLDISDLSAPQFPLSNLLERNPFFTGRELVLAQLQEALADRGRTALSGLGGVGKTQTAVEYAHRHLNDYVYMFWATAHSREAIASSYVTIAALLKLVESDAQDQTRAVEAVKHWLGSHEHWLLILDNVDRPDTIKPFVPAKPMGHILFTSRAQVFDTIGIVKPVELNEMSPGEARTFLLRRTGRRSRRAKCRIRTQRRARLLATCARRVHSSSKTTHFQDYLRSFRKRKLELLNKRDPVAGDYPQSVRTTWSMNFRQLEKESKAAADLLRLSAFLSLAMLFRRLSPTPKRIRSRPGRGFYAPEPFSWIAQGPGPGQFPSLSKTNGFSQTDFFSPFPFLLEWGSNYHKNGAKKAFLSQIWSHLITETERAITKME